MTYLLRKNQRKWVSILLIVLLSTSLDPWPGGRPLLAHAYLTSGGTCAAKHGFSVGPVALNDGDFSQFSMAVSGIEDLSSVWMSIKMAYSVHVETLLVKNRDDDDTTAMLRINPSTFSVGDNADVTLNTSCGGTITASKIFIC